jgi:ribosomal protein S18 acetylase RimI-like enzyme
MPHVRPARRDDVPAIVQLQTISLPHFRLPDPGPAFLRTFYTFVLRDHRGLLFVSEHNSTLAGFVVGFSNSGCLYTNFASDRPRILAATWGCLVRHPIQLPRFLKDLGKASQLTRDLDARSETDCELVTIAIQPRLRRQGHGKALALALLEAARRNKMTRAHVLIGRNDDGMAMFYRRLGFTPFRALRASETQWMVEYVLTIQENARAS